MADLTCKTCGGPVNTASGYRVFKGPKGDKGENWFDTEACLAQDADGSKRVSPGFGRVNIKDQPPMILVPAPTNHRGQIVPPEAMEAMMAGRMGGSE